jgi:hypothetical protein
MKHAVLIALCAAMCVAKEPRRPACNARNQGQFWPAEANSSQSAARQLARSGELEMCSLVVWKYRWEHMTVNARELAKPTDPGRLPTR